jgi:hypothetical protein
MDNPHRIEASKWQDSPLPAVPKNRGPRGFLSPTLVGILGTLLLHGLVIQSLPFGRGLKARPPEARESADSLSKSETDPAESLVLIQLLTITNSRKEAIRDIGFSLPDLSKTNIKSPVNIESPAWLNIETLALSEDAASKSANAGGDGAEQARLFGIYTGQIQARIDRVWRRPRTPVDEHGAGKEPTGTDDSFQCEAQIVQDDRGNVQQILLPRCNGSAAWQRSLVLAIQQASPLPAPPSIKVFSQSITLRFVGLPFVQGALNDEYEIVPHARVDQ